MRITRKATMVLGVVGSLAMAATAGAQISFTTSGYFSSPSATCNLSNVCTGSGFTLTYHPETVTNLGFGNTDLGYFDLVGTGNAAGTVDFFLTVAQTTPQGGNQPLTGTISGQVSTSPDGSTLVYSPNPTFFQIGSVQYTLQETAGVNGYPIGLNNAPTNPNAYIAASVTTTPEPSSMALLGTGLIGLVPMVRRRRK